MHNHLSPTLSLSTFIRNSLHFLSIESLFIDILMLSLHLASAIGHNDYSLGLIRHTIEQNSRYMTNR
jgi:hypothetical protein